MADKTYNITLPDGNTINVPAWASQETLEQLVSKLEEANVIDKNILSNLREIDVDSEALGKGIGVLYETVKQNTKNSQKNAEKISDNAEKLGKGVADTVNNLSNTEKPLSKMIDYAGMGITGGGKLLGKGLESLSGQGTVTSQRLESLTKVLGGITTSGLAYAGFVAGQVEQLADAQRVMIDSGAVFSDADDVGRLVDNIKQVGITYTKLSEIVSNYTRGIAYIGGSTADGARVFSNRLNVLMEDLEQFSDFGFSVDEIADAYAQYLNIARLQQLTDQRLADGSSSLDVGFQNLLAESSALSALTKQSRSDILGRIVTAFEDPKLSASLSVISQRDSSLANTVTEATKIFQTRATEGVESASGGLYSILQSALNEAVTNYRGRPEDFEITSFLNELDPTLTAALQASGILETMENAFKSGDIDALKNAVDIDLPRAILNMELSAQGQGELGQRLLALQTALILQQQELGQLQGKDQSEVQAATEELKKDIKGNAEGIAAVNNFSQTLLKVQSAITPNLQDASEVVRKFSETLKEGTETIQKVTGVEYSQTVINSKLSPERIERIQKAVADGEVLSAEDRELLEDMVIAVRRENRDFLSTVASNTAVGTGMGAGVGFLAGGIGAVPGAITGAIGGFIGGVANYLGAGDLLEDTANMSVSNSTLMSELLGYKPEDIIDAYKNTNENRFMGGPVEPGMSYTVGEKGPEQIIPMQPGYVVSTEDLEKLRKSDVDSSDYQSLVENRKRTLETMVSLENALRAFMLNKKINKTVSDYS